MKTKQSRVMVKTPVGMRLRRCNCNSDWEIDHNKNHTAVCFDEWDKNPHEKCPACGLFYWVNDKKLRKQ